LMKAATIQKRSYNERKQKGSEVKKDGQ